MTGGAAREAARETAREAARVAGEGGCKGDGEGAVAHAGGTRGTGFCKDSGETEAVKMRNMEEPKP